MLAERLTGALKVPAAIAALIAASFTAGAGYHAFFGSIESVETMDARVRNVEMLVWCMYNEIPTDYCPAPAPEFPNATSPVRASTGRVHTVGSK